MYVNENGEGNDLTPHWFHYCHCCMQIIFTTTSSFVAGNGLMNIDRLCWGFWCRKIGLLLLADAKQ